MLSVDQPTTSQPMSLNCWMLSLNATISVGQTNVKSSGQAKNTCAIDQTSEGGDYARELQRSQLQTLLNTGTKNLQVLALYILRVLGRQRCR